MTLNELEEIKNRAEDEYRKWRFENVDKVGVKPAWIF